MACSAYRIALGVMTGLAALLAPTMPAHAGVEVTDCTEAALDSVLVAGGAITFNCGGTHAPATISFSTYMSITINTTIDGTNGGHPVTLDGTGGTRLFSVATGVALTLTHLVLADGTANGGGCLYTNGALVLNAVEIKQCRANGAAGQGGALYVADTGSATLIDANVHDNEAGVSGGGLYSLGPLTVTRSTLAHNSAASVDGGGLWAASSTRVAGSTFFSNTAAAGWGGGIYNQGTLSMTDSVLDSNFAGQGGGGSQTYIGMTALQNVTVISNSVTGGTMYPAGGGLSVAGTLTLTNVRLSGNTANYSGGGLAVYNYFHGVYNLGTATLIGVTFNGNSIGDGYGGGLYSEGTTVLTNTTFSGNQAQGYGGAIGINVPAGLTLSNSTLSDNSAWGYGGGIYNDGTITLTNSTLSGNASVYGGGGGGIANYGGRAFLMNVTLAGNSALTGGSLQQASQWPLTLRNTILAADPASTNCDTTNSPAPIVSSGYNLSSDGTCTAFLNHGGDVNNTYPYLAALADNGGPTLTQRPEPPSRAIDAIPNGVNGCGTAPAADQRGAPRPINGQCDIGAVEVGWLYNHLWLALIRR